jgi:thioredoxin reductase
MPDSGPSAHALDVPGARLYYERRGTGPLLLMIGSPMDSTGFAGLASALAGEYTVVTYDPRCIGNSSREDTSQDVTPGQQADDVHRLLSALGGGQASVFGSSGGATVGLALVTAHPGQVRTLVAHEPPVVELLPDSAQVRAQFEDIYATYRADGPDQAMQKFLAHAGLTGAPEPEADAPLWEPPPEQMARMRATNEAFLAHLLRPTTYYRPGGQIGTTSRIENYLGFPVGISGDEFAQRAYIQVLRFGASVVLPATATGLSGDDTARVIHLDTGDSLTALSVIIATGVTYRTIDATGLDRFGGLGVFYSPLGVHDEIHPGEPVVIAGGGNSAGQAAIWLADRGHRVTIAVRGADLAESMSRYLIDRITGRPDIEVRDHTVVRDLHGSQWLERVGVENLTTRAHETLPAAALVVLVGAEPHTGWLAGSVLLDEVGYLLTGPALDPDTRHRSPWTGRHHDPYLLETSAPGVFAAGDVRSGSVKRAAAAVGEGSIAVRFVSEHLGRRAGFATPARWPAGLRGGHGTGQNTPSA